MTLEDFQNDILHFVKRETKIYSKRVANDIAILVC